MGQSALYPCLHKLEQNGWIKSEWAISENNRRAKYYSLTKAGQKVPDRETAQWERLSAAFSLRLLRVIRLRFRSLLARGTVEGGTRRGAAIRFRS